MSNKTFISSQSLTFNTQFKYYLLHNYKNNMLIYLQHGHGYGMDQSNLSERYEVNLCDFFLTYGWRSRNKKVIPFFQDSYLDINYKSSSGIIILSSVAPKHLHRFQQFPIGYSINKNFIENNIKFLNNLSINKKVYFRNYPNSDKYGWNFSQSVKKKHKDLIIDNEKNIYESISKKQIVVCDHFGTSFMELLQFDKPCIIYFDLKSYSFNNHLKKCIHDLCKVNIIFYDPKKAADHLNGVIYNLDNWWNDNNTVKAKNTFRNLFCRKARNYDYEFLK